MTIIFVDELPVYLEKLLTGKGFRVILGASLSPSEILQLSCSQDTGWVIRSRFVLNQHFFAQAPHRIRFIARFGAGLENIDTDWCRLHSISCYHSPQGNSDAVADHALGLLLSLSKRIAKSFFEVKKGLWLREENRGWEIGDKTIAIIGFGNTGSRFAKRLSGFDCRVLAYDKYLPQGYARDFPNVKESDMKEIFLNADVVSLHLPLTRETSGLVRANFIQQFNKTICMINTSRGKIVDSNAVLNALQSGKISAFGADVLDLESLSFEKLQAESSGILEKLLASDKVVITPHIAGWSFESNRKMSDILAAQITRDFLPT